MPFKLVGMTEKEFYKELYRGLDDVAEIPSDGGSNISDDDMDSNGEPEIQDCEIEIIEEDGENETDDNDGFDSEDNIPLSMLARTKLQWSRNVSVEQPPDFNAYAGVPHFIKSMDDPTPYKLFQLFFTDDIIENLVFQTNLYCQQGVTKYYPTNLTEMKTFLGINLLMGIKSLPSYRDHWSSAPDLHDSYISKLMTVKRFSWFLSKLHMNDNSVMPERNEDGYDKLYKVRPLLTELAKNFANCMAATKELALDESMIKFKGRSCLKQYMPKKPIKRGYKVWMLADKNGYCHKFEIYTGRSEVGITEKNLGERVVLKLTNEFAEKNHLLFFDNYFCSVQLMEKLKSKKLFACGTVNSNRKNIPTFKPDRAMKRGEYEWFSSNSGLSVMKWKDKRSVHLLSNFHDPRESTEVTRKEKNGTTSKVPCPMALFDYNKNMNFVDKFDQHLSIYKIDRKSHKWYHRIFFYFLDSAVVNSFVVYKQLELPKMTMKDFRRRIVDGLVSKRLIEEKKTVYKMGSPIIMGKNKPYVSVEVRQEESAHQPHRTSRRRCALCSTKKEAVRTNWMCSICKVPLCLGKEKNCFQQFHNKN